MTIYFKDMICPNETTKHFTVRAAYSRKVLKQFVMAGRKLPQCIWVNWLYSESRFPSLRPQKSPLAKSCSRPTAAVARKSFHTVSF